MFGGLQPSKREKELKKKKKNSNQIQVKDVMFYHECPEEEY